MPTTSGASQYPTACASSNDGRCALLCFRALSDALDCTIVVHSAGVAPLRLQPLDSEIWGENVTPGADRPGQHQRLRQQPPELHISYHRQQYLLGEHYNSVVPINDSASDI